MKKAFWLNLLSSIILLSSSAFAASSFAPEVNKDYRVVEPAIALPFNSPNKVYVQAFFWYGCPHCKDLEPLLEAWIHRQPKNIIVQRVPVAFDQRLWPHSRLYYTLETLGRLDLHEKFFYVFHTENRHLIKENEIIDWLVKEGLSRKQVSETFNSFAVNNKILAANKAVADYRLDGVPALAVQGKYFTSPAMTGSNERAVTTLEWLVNQASQENKEKVKRK